MQECKCAQFYSNAKGALLERGGTVRCNKVPEKPDHAPQFCAVATLDGSTREGLGASKKESEQAAARLLLESVACPVCVGTRLPRAYPDPSTHTIPHPTTISTDATVAVAVGAVIAGGLVVAGALHSLKPPVMQRYTLDAEGAPLKDGRAAAGPVEERCLPRLCVPC